MGHGPGLSRSLQRWADGHGLGLADPDLKDAGSARSPVVPVMALVDRVSPIATPARGLMAARASTSGVARYTRPASRKISVLIRRPSITGQHLESTSTEVSMCP
jgi:hypothetical protein